MAGTATLALPAQMPPLLRARAPHLWHGLRGAWTAPVLALRSGGSPLSGWPLLRRSRRRARAAAVAQVPCLLAGWWIAQHPYLVCPDLTVHGPAGRPAARHFLLWTLPPGMALLPPSLWYCTG